VASLRNNRSVPSRENKGGKKHSQRKVSLPRLKKKKEIRHLIKRYKDESEKDEITRRVESLEVKKKLSPHISDVPH